MEFGSGFVYAGLGRQGSLHDMIIVMYICTQLILMYALATLSSSEQQDQ